MKRFACLISTLVFAACAPAITTGVSVGSAASADRIAADVRAVSSDVFLGRGPATRGEDLTTNYIRARLEAAGVKPGGPNGSWFQDVPLSKSDITGAPSVSVGVGGQTIPLKQGDQVAIRASMQNVDRVNIQNAALVFLGYGVRSPERNWDDFKGEDVRGKVGIVLINDPDFETGQGDFGGKAMTYYGRWTYKYEEAARQGLAGLLIVHETAPASYGWATVKNSNTNTMFDIVRTNPAEVHPLLEGWIQRNDAIRLLAAAGQDFDALKRRAQTREFRPVPLANATFSASYQVKRETIRSKNVLGRLPGTVHPDETILFGAHWDHLGVGAPDARGDTIYNGAVDNGTGIGAVLELARVFAAEPRTERSLVFAFWTAEEKGLLGSEYYASNPVYALETTVAGFNIDALSPAGRARDVLIVGSGQTDIEDRLTAVLAANNRVMTPDPSPEAGYFFRSDHFPIAKRGVPMLYMDSGIDLLTGGTGAGRAADEAYRRDKYHQPADEYDAATWNLTGIAEDVAVLHRLGLQLANSREWPNYRESSEFRPVRDKSAARRRQQAPGPVVPAVIVPAAATPPVDTRTIAERLGHPADSKLLIIHADDLGAAHSVNAASFDALEKGAISSVSAMVPTPWITEVAAYAKAHPNADIGLHLTLTSEWETYRWGSTESADKVPSLMDSTGTFPNDEKFVAARSKPLEVEREIRAQIDRAMALGIRPTHLDSHMGALFTTPELIATYVKVAHDYRLPFLALRASPLAAPQAGITAQDILLDAVIIAGREVPRDQWKAFYLKSIAELKPGLTELIVHLGYDDRELQAVMVDHEAYGATWRQKDYDVVNSPEFKKALRDNRVILVTWRELQKLAQQP